MIVNKITNQKMKKIALTLILVTSFYNNGYSKNTKKQSVPDCCQMVRIYKNGDKIQPSSKEIDKILNQKIPHALQKISKTGINPLNIFSKQ
ncbi:MAG: hypothetical protein A2X17_05110 [Bacteroidetes bacterium GWF2_41_61]|nr:MAG: hypothetical protein A2X20_07770 [Bacteroidetes bacterium GWE2_40_15]OFY36793.1 MAG: hypothetical protein A2X17_05110 [Bacteroidetes bacterium GWF2_41_61]HBG23724.1 hypothetical protein [Rikenellaceae bacterium]HBZ26027.1 hypothetical protein [Rikenellaceae bacterium]